MYGGKFLVQADICMASKGSALASTLSGLTMNIIVNLVLVELVIHPTVVIQEKSIGTTPPTTDIFEVFLGYIAS
jgi:hypothetical protein